MKKIMMISPSVPDPRIMNRVDALAGSYRQVFVYWDRTEGKIAIDNSKLERVYVINGKSKGMKFRTLFGYLTFLVKAVKKIRLERPDIIHAYRLEPLMAACWYRALGDRHVKIVYEIADLPSCVFPRGKNPFKRILSGIAGWLEKRMIKKVSLLVFTSPGFYNHYYHKFASDKPKVYQECVVNPKALEGYERKSAFPETVTMGFFGNMRYLDAIENGAKAAESVSKARFKLAGFTQNERRLKKIVDKYTKTEYSGIFQSYSLGKLYEPVDIIYTVYETSDINATVLLPNKYYEAIQLGLPIIVSRGTYLAELVEEKGIGYVIEDGDERALTAILETLDEKEMARIRANCEKQREYYDTAKHNRMLKEAYGEYLK